MNYYRRHWDETTGDDLTDSWGTSTFFFETDTDNNVLRQLQIFENGKGLKYWDNFVGDDYGMLTDQPLDSDDFDQYRIDKNEFEKFGLLTIKNRIRCRPLQLLTKCIIHGADKEDPPSQAPAGQGIFFIFAQRHGLYINVMRKVSGSASHI